MSEFDDYEEEHIGAEVASERNGKFVNLRIGQLAQVSKTQLPGYSPASTVNKANTVFHFFAKPYKNIAGYVRDMKWHTKTFEDGSVVKGWYIFVDSGADGEFIIDLKMNDRPFHRVMAVLLNINFDRPVRFNAFMGEQKQNGKSTGKKQKVMNLYQGKKNPETGKPETVKPIYEDKWLSNELLAKVKAFKAGKPNITFTEQDERNLHRNAKGEIDGEYPYIRQNVDGSWSFDAWTNFLLEKMHEEVIPNIHAAQEIRDQAKREEDSGGAEESEFSGPVPEDTTPTGPTDEIPF